MNSKVVAVWGSPSSGKTSLCAVIARLLAKKNKNVLLLSTDSFVSALSVWLPFTEPRGSIGHVLTTPNFMARDIAAKTTLCPKDEHIGVLAISRDENCVTYPSIEKESSERLLNIAKEMSDIIIVDCSSFFIFDMLTLSALEFSDYVIRLQTADTRGTVFTLSQLQVLSDDIFNTQKHLKICNCVKDYHPVEEASNAVGSFDFILPFNEELESKYMTGKLFEDFYTPIGKEYIKGCEKIVSIVKGGI